ncbi:MAG: TonB-dependent receptor [Prevotellaceae bacterium]|jgi:outer membrane receptor protein involved in Fe transport|nr:TonB-dependent receptor [Prevotellaceae bacterium]
MQKYLKFLIAALGLCFSLTAFSQNGNTTAKRFTISGTAIDSETAKGLPYTTISVRKDSVSQEYIKRAAADADGKFEFEIKLDSASCILVFEAAGKENIEKQVDFETNKINIGKIEMQDAANQLSAVQVTAYKPLVTQDIDRVGYNLEEDPESKTNTVIEMLRKVPMVTVDQEDEIKVKGSANFKIYLNGKPSNMITKNPKDVLKSMPASSIKKIEVITDPGAKYDAEGVTAILNIVTQSALQGYTGSIRVSASTKGQFGAGGYIQTKIGKFGVTANMNWGQYGSPSWNENHTENYGQNMPYKYSSTYGESNYKGNYIYGNLEASYEFDSLNLLSASVGVNGGNSRSPNSLSRTYMRNELNDTISAYNSKNNAVRSYYGISGNIDYQRTFKKPEQLLTLSYLLDLSPNTYNNISIIEKNDSFPDLLQTTREMNQEYLTLGKSDEHTFQIDYTEPFDSNKHVIEAGLKYILRINSSDNNYKLFNEISGKYDLDTIRQNDDGDMKYYQHIFGAYASYIFKLKKFSVRAGGRLEGTMSDVRFSENPLRNFKADFVSLIPSVSISYKPKDAHNLRLSYTNGISRPSIWYLNPYIDDSNPYSVSHGNPDLKPARSHNVSFNYGLVKQKFNFNISASYAITLNDIQDTVMLRPDGIRETTYANIGKNQQAGAYIYLNYNPAKWVRLWLNGGGSYSNYENQGQKHEGYFGANVWGGVQFTLPWKLRLNLNGGGSTPWNGYKSKSSAWYYYGLSLSRSFLKGDKLTVSINASNPFEKYRTWKWSSWEKDIYLNTGRSKQLSREFRLSLSFRFGEMKAQIKKAERGISNDDVKSGGGQSGQGGQGGGGQ